MVLHLWSNEFPRMISYKDATPTEQKLLQQETQVVLPTHITSGMYFYRVQSEAGSLGSGKMLVLQSGEIVGEWSVFEG